MMIDGIVGGALFAGTQRRRLCLRSSLLTPPALADLASAGFNVQLQIDPTTKDPEPSGGYMAPCGWVAISLGKKRLAYHATAQMSIIGREHPRKILEELCDTALVRAGRRRINRRPGHLNRRGVVELT